MQILNKFTNNTPYEQQHYAAVFIYTDVFKITVWQFDKKKLNLPTIILQ